MIQPWQIKSWAVAHKGLIVIALGFFLLLVLWWSGINVIGKVSNWWYQVGTEAAHEEIQKYIDEANAAKQVTAETLKAWEVEKLVTASEREKRETLEKLLADKSKSTDAKIKLYEEALKRIPDARTEPESTDEQCKRAAELGIKLTICE